MPSTPLARHLLRVRDLMDRAMALLRADELSVTGICHAVGFSSLGSFSTQFRRFVGTSPSDYRARTAPHDLAQLPGCLVKRHTRPQLRNTAVLEKQGATAAP